MLPVRIIPRLDIKGPTLVKGVQLEGLRVLGPPESFARYYYESGADELIYMDVVASLFERNSLVEFVRRTSAEIFIPLTVGGGIRTLRDVEGVLAAGADKVAVNTAAIRRPEFITQIADRFGSSTVVVSLEVKQIGHAPAQVYTDNGRIPGGREAQAWAREAVKRGAGELLITSVDHEGMGGGFAVELTKEIASRVSVPVVASGGAGKLEHVQRVFSAGHISGAAIASLFHYRAMQNLPGVPAGAPKAFSRITPASIPDLKAFLTEKGLDCRYEPCDAQLRQSQTPVGHS